MPLASTTMFRAYYDRLPADPLADGDDPAIEMARAAWERMERGRWAGPLREALERTARIAGALEGVTGEDSLWHGQS